MNHRGARERIAEDLAERDRHAVWTVAAHALDRDDCAELLAMLGLEASIGKRCSPSGPVLPSVPSSPPLGRGRSTRGVDGSKEPVEVSRSPNAMGG